MPGLRWRVSSLLAVSVLAVYVQAELSREKMLFTALRDSDCQINCTGERKRSVCGSDGIMYPSHCELLKAKKCEKRNIEVQKKQKCRGNMKMLFTALRDSDCQINCTGERKRSVCGSDGIMYPSHCELLKAKKCEKRNIEVQKKRKCRASAALTRCLKERREALVRLPTKGVFIPQCQKDGSYAQVQCHAGTGFCWCMTRDGKPMMQTSVNGGRPNCKEKNKRRKKRKRRKGCSKKKRDKFNSNLIMAFELEFNRVSRQSASTTSLPTGKSPKAALNTAEKQKKIVEWKYNELDRNKDGVLKYKEVRSLRKMVKKFVKPRRCAKRFVKYCDADLDRKIGRKEWSLCLGLNLSKEQTTQVVHEVSDSQAGKIPPSSPWNLPSHSRRTIPEPTRSQPDQHPRSCLEERAVAVKSDREDPAGKIYIPECTSEGKYNKTQCHQLPQQICWCVNEVSGMTIPATSSFNSVPNCDMKPERELKGCPSSTKRRFLIELMQQMTSEMEAYINSTGKSYSENTTEAKLSKTEIVVRWKLRAMDKNNNGILEKTEINKFKKDLRRRNSRSLKKCRRKFVRYCDENKNKKISMDEFIDCMGVHRNYYSLPTHPTRQGPNPLNKYLKDD